jgi:hypothetical protein
MAKEKCHPENSGSCTDDIERDGKGRFVPGKSANPAGKPKGSVSIVTEIKAKLQEIDPKSKKTFLELFTAKLFKKALKEGDTAIMRDIIDRVDGKPLNPTSFQNPDGSSLDLAPVNIIINPIKAKND